MNSIKIKFLGACGTVTGSRFLIECEDDNILIECGLFQGSRELRSHNWDPFPYPASEIKNIALTHAHIDHSGYLPRLVRNGYSGKAHVTTCTRDLLGILLPDAAMLQEEDAAFYNRKKLSRHAKALPLFTSLDAKRALQLLVQHKPSRESNIGDRFTIEFIPIGHILGACMIKLTIRNDNKETKILFSGDIGRYYAPILNDPTPPPLCDILVIESTYGDRLHVKTPSPREELGEAVIRIVDNKGVLLIPAFAVGRTQDILYHLRTLEMDNRIPEIPVYVDSPMAIDVTQIYMNHPERFDDELLGYIQKDKNFLNPGYFHMVRSPVESRKLNSLGGPMIIISASGMLTGGRIRHHLYHRISDPSAELLFVGFQAEGTRGRALQEGAKTIHVFKDELPVRARISSIEGFSAHADYEEMLKWLSGIPEPPKQIFVVHGEDKVRPVFAAKIKDQFSQSEVLIPNLKDEHEI